jgi:hypothetical protein
MPTLRDDIFANQPRSNNLLPQEVDALAASGMGDLRRGWESGRIGNDLNPLRTQELDAQIANDLPRAQTLRDQIGVLEQRQQMYAPRVGDLRDIHGVGDGLDWAAGQVGQGAASMIDPMAVSAGLGMVGRVAGAVPHPVAKGVGLAATGASVAIPALMSKNQLTGEFIGEAEHDKELMANTSPQRLRDMAGNYGMAAAIPDSFLPGMIGRQLVGATARKAGERALLGAGGKTLMGMGAEGITEGGQAAGSQYARGLLNPNRDTSGDNWDIINNAAGGFIGAGPFSAAGAYSEAGHNRVGAGVAAVKGKAGEVVDLMNDARSSDTGKKVERSIKDLWEGGKAKVGDTIDLAKEKATDFATGEDGSVSVGNAVDNVYTKYEHMRMRKEDKDTLDSGFPEGFTDLPPAQQAAWLVKDDAAKREVIDRVLEKSEDPEAKAHIAALQAGTDPAALDNALDFARHITREESTMEVVKDAAESAASWAGELAGKAARGAAGLGVAAAKGAMRGATGKKNAQSAGFTTTSYEDWQARREAMNPANTVADGVQDKVNAGIPGTMAEKKAKEDSYRRAVMTGEYLASLVKPKRGVAPKPEVDDFVRQLGYEITDLADSWGIAGRLPKPTDAAAIQRQSPGLSMNLDSLAYEMNGVLGEAAGDALAFIERTMDPRSAPMFEYLRERLISGETTAGRMMRETARTLAKQEMGKLLPRHHFVEIMQAGPAAMDKVFSTFEKLSRGRAKPNDRELVDELLGTETVNRIMSLVSGLAVEGKPEKVIEEGVSEFDKAAGEKKLSKGGAAIYGFGAKLAPRTGGDIFARTNTLNEQEKINAAAAGEDITQRPRLFKGTTDGKTGKVTGTDLLPSGDNMLDFKIAEMEKRVGYVRGKVDPDQEAGWNDTNKGWGVDTVSAHDAMEGFGPTRKLALYRDYLRQESSVKEGKTQTPEQQEQAARSTAIGRLLGRVVAHDKKPSGPSSQWTERQNQEWQAALKLAQETGHKGEESWDVSEAALDNHQVKTALAEAEAFFRDRHIVRAYSMTDNDPTVLGLDKAMEMEKKAEKIEDSVRLAADKAERRGDDEAANKLRSDANLLYFTRDGKEFPIAVRDLVLWARKAKDHRGQTQDEDDVNHSEASENGRYADDVWAGISEFVDLHADGMPYKINPAGEKEYFEVGKKGALTAVPDSLMLQNKPFFQARNDGDLSYKFESVLGIRRKHQAADGPNRGRDPEDVRDRASNQRKINREADKNADFFTAEQREEMDPEVDDRAQKSSATKNKLHRVGDRGYMENGKYIPIDQGRATGGEFGYSTDRSGQVASEPKITEADENQNKTPLDFTKGQDPKAEADENTNQSWFTKQTMPRFESPTSAMHGMSSAKHNAAGILRVMMGNQVQEGDGVINGVEGTRANKSIPGMTTYEDEVFNRKTGGMREGDRLVVTMLRTALEPDNKRKGAKYEAYRIAPLIQLVSNNREADGKGFREKSNVEYFLQAGATPALVNIVRRGAAQVLIRPEINISDADRLTLARQLLGSEKITALGLTKKLQDFLNAEGGRVNEEIAVNWGDPSLMPADVAMKTQPAPKVAPKTIREKAAAKAAEPAAPREPQAWDLTLDEIDSIGASTQTTTAAKPKPIPESAAAQAAIDRARTATVDDETKRQIRNAAGQTEADKERARVERNKTAGTAASLAAMQAEIARLTALMAKGEQAPATKATPAAPKVAAPAPEGYVVKAPSADLQSKIDAALPKSDGTYLTAIKAAIQRNEMWVASGDAGPNVAKIDIPKLKSWAGMSEAQAKAAVESNNSPNMGRIVKTLQAGSTGSPLGKPSGAALNAQSPDGEHTLASAGEMAAARAWLEKVAPGTILNFIKESGWSGEFVEATNTVNVAIGAAAGILNTTYHEGLHKFFAQFVRSNPQLKAKFDSLVNDPRVRDRIHALLEGYPAAQAQLSDGEERLAYAFQFWKAGLLRIDNENRSILQKVGALFRRVFGMVRDSEHALAIFQAFDAGKLAKPSIAAQVIAKQLGKGTMALRARRGLDGLMQGLGAAVLPAEVILGGNEHSPTARRLGAIMFTNPGKESAGGGQVGYLNAKRSQGKVWANRANEVFENMDEADISAVQKYMQAQTDVADIKMEAHRKAVTTLRTTMKEFHTYLRESGLKIGEVDKYYPVVWSVDALHKNKDKFISMLVEKYPRELSASDGDLPAAAERIHAALIARNGVDNKSLKASREEETGIKEVIREDGVLSPFFAGQEGRMLWWLKGKDSEEFQSKSITHTLSQYFHQGVRAAEYRRRFGESGVRLEAMIKEIRAEITNASREVYPLVKNKLSLVPGSMEYVNDQKQIANRNKWVARQMRDISMSIGAIEGTLGKDISPNMRKFSSYMIAYQNVRLLPYMIFSSFVDPLAQVARGAPLNAALETFTYGMREVFRSWADMFRDMPKARQKDEWTKLAEHIGAIEVAMFNHHVADEYSSVYMSPVARKINETLFKMNGMEAWDRANRTMATKWAVRFIEQHAALPDKNHSARWLQELGLSAATVPLNADGQLITTAEELSVVKSISPQLAKIEIAKVHAALNRWVEGAVISPNAAQRPGWSSDPNYASVFHLKQFSYSFQQTIMQRAVNEMGHGNLTPITALAGFVPTMLVADIMKGLLQGGGTLPAYIAGMDIGERIGHAVERSGVMGTGDIVGAALQDWSSLGGPAFEQIVDGIRDSSDRTLTKAIPLHAMGEHLFSGRSALEVAGP